MKIFISQRMNGMSVECIEKDRKAVKDVFGPRHEYIENYIHENAPENANQIWHLGESIKQMSEADAVIFSNDWFNAKGCNIEYQICKTYGLFAGILQYDKEGKPYVLKID